MLSANAEACLLASNHDQQKRLLSRLRCKTQRESLPEEIC